MGTPIGFPDWSKQTPADEDLLVSQTAFHATAPASFGAGYVGHWDSLQGLLFCPDQQVLWTFIWFADELATIEVGRRELTTNPAIARPLTFCLTNLGPFLTIEATATVPAAGFDLTLFVYGSSRATGSEVFSSGLVLANQVPVVVPNGTTIRFYMRDYHAGLAHTWLFCDQALTFVNWLVDVNAAGAEAISQISLPALVNTNLDLILPAGAVSMQARNISGVNANLSVSIVASRVRAS